MPSIFNPKEPKNVKAREGPESSPVEAQTDGDLKAAERSLLTQSPATTAPTALPTHLSIHNTRDWLGYSVTCCPCAPDPIYNFMNVGYMPWKVCMREASRYGAMLFASAYTTFGWVSHRELACPDSSSHCFGAQYFTGSWSIYAVKDIMSSANCIIARDTRAAATRNQPLNKSITYDNDVWMYADYGENVYYDQCQLQAGQHGASIITPQTLVMLLLVINL